MPDGALNPPTAVTPRNFQLLRTGIDVRPALAELDANEYLWREYPERCFGPHQQVDDIWVRWRKREELTHPSKYNEEHFASFHDAWWRLPGLHSIVYDLMAQVRAVYLGGILLTRIPPGKEVLPHHDRGPWHPEFHNCKVYVPLKTNGACINYCDGDAVVMRDGDAWTFDNLKVHSVVNAGDAERITLIVCMRVEL